MEWTEIVALIAGIITIGSFIWALIRKLPEPEVKFIPWLRQFKTSYPFFIGIIFALTLVIFVLISAFTPPPVTSPSTPTPTDTSTQTPTTTSPPTYEPTPTTAPIPTPTPICENVSEIPMKLIAQPSEIFEKPGEGFLLPLEACDIPGQPEAIKLRWDVSKSESYAGCIIQLPDEFASVALGKTHLVIWVQGDQGGEQFKIGLSSSDGREWKELVSQVPEAGQQIEIPLSCFEKRGVDLTNLDRLIIAFENEFSGRGSICIGQIGFCTP